MVDVEKKFIRKVESFKERVEKEEGYSVEFMQNGKGRRMEEVRGLEEEEKEKKKKKENKYTN